MVFDKQLNVSGVTVTLRPYTAKRQSQLDAINAEIQDFIAKNPEWTWNDIPHAVKASFWQRKAEVLWDAEYPKGFFESEDFEYSLLKDTEIHFTTMQVYL